MIAEEDCASVRNLGMLNKDRARGSTVISGYI
jgi:hypothetical protein